jgi:hypothetical protein
MNRAEEAGVWQSTLAVSQFSVRVRASNSIVPDQTNAYPEQTRTKARVHSARHNNENIQKRSVDIDVDGSGIGIGIGGRGGATR